MRDVISLDSARLTMTLACVVDLKFLQSYIYLMMQVFVTSLGNYKPGPGIYHHEVR